MARFLGAEGDKPQTPRSKPLLAAVATVAFLLGSLGWFLAGGGGTQQWQGVWVSSGGGGEGPRRSTLDPSRAALSKQLAPGGRRAGPAGDGKRWAYVFYATDTQYFCNSLVNAKRLRRDLAITDQADIVIVYSESLGTPGAPANQRVERMMKRAQELRAVLKPVSLIRQSKAAEPTWAESLTKLRIFELEDYARVVYMDADGLVWRNMDHLFLLPPARVAMPRAYWLPAGVYSDQIAVIEPKAEKLQPLLDEAERTGSFDMDVMNTLYKDSCLTLPNEYDVLSGAFRDERHSNYADGDRRAWDSKRMLKEAYYIHYSDWPIPKPWLAREEELEGRAPPCPGRCEDREAWLGLYSLFRKESKICEA